MAKLTSDTTRSDKMKAIRAEKKAQQDLWTPVDAPIETPKQVIIEKQEKIDPTMKAILDRLEKQEAELKLLRGDKDINKDAKEKYKWPWKYAFSLWTGVPVVSIEYFLKDPEADLVYQNQNWMRVENQYARLTLLNGKVVETSNYLYNKNKTKSDHFFAKLGVWADGETTYTFNEPKYGEFTILSSKFIN